MRKYPCFVCGCNMVIAARRRVVFLEDDGHAQVEVGDDCYRNIVNAGAAGVCQKNGPNGTQRTDTVRVFATLEQARAFRRDAALAPYADETGRRYIAPGADGLQAIPLYPRRGDPK